MKRIPGFGNAVEMSDVIAIVKSIPDSATADAIAAKTAAEAAQLAAEDAASTVESATVAETKSHLGIS